MADRVSLRIANAVAALPISGEMRVLEIGCGPGVAARLVSQKLTTGNILAIDRSEKAVTAAIAGSEAEIATGRLAFRCVAIEDFVLEPGEQPFDLAFAMRVGALDGRHRELEARALGRLKAALGPNAVLVIDDATPLSGADLPDFP